MTASRWPAVVDALLAALRAAPALTGVEVLDGPPVGQPSGLDQVCIGHTLDDTDDDSGTITQAWRTTGGAAALRDEYCDIRCAVRAVSGDTAMTGTRTRAFALLDAVSTVLRAGWTLDLDGVVAVEVATGRVRQVQVTGGSGTAVEFTIRVQSVI